jgi:beta-lactamase superfamily II metal-dependent hydrolase
MGYEIDFLAVGEGARSGDAIALRFGNLFGSRLDQTVVVIDGGYTSSGEELVKHIQKWYGTNYVDLVISTHPDADHSAGLAVVLEQLRVGTLWMHLPWNHTEDIARMFQCDRVTDKSVRESLRRSLDSARDLERLARRRSIPIVEPFAGLIDATGRVIVAGPSEKFYESLLPGFRGTPEPVKSLGLIAKAFEAGKEVIRRVAERWDVETLTDDGETSPENNSSAMILVKADDNDFKLFTGDAGIPGLTAGADYLNARGVDSTKLTFVQVPHHGSQRNVGPTILNRLIGPKQREEGKIKTAIVSAAKDGEPKHPSKKVTNAFRRRGAHVYATQGLTKHHYKDAPNRDGYSSANPLPFYFEVEE